jgi:putative heme-binding domain-containing protein
MRSFLILLLVVSPVFAQRDAKVPDPDPELERKTFKLPDGFEANLFAADPLLMKPIQMNFDSAGRLWVACSEAYPQILPGAKQNDRIIILEDTKGTGKADRTTVFADGLLIPTGLEPGDGGVYVVDSTDLIHFSDSTGKGKADKRRVVLSGFGTEDTHHMVHTLRWGPDGLLYFNQSIYIHSHIETPHGPRHLNAGGTWMFRPETMQLEVFARGWINHWGHHFDRFGQSFVTDGAGGEGVNYVVPGASYPTAHGASRILHGLNPGSPKYCGCEILSGRHLPDDWQGNLITNDFRGHRVCRFVLKEDGTGFAAAQQVDLIRSSHPAFRPIDVKMGPDGAIYIADWYNPIIQHGEVDFRDPRRDHTHGRIWRITYRGRPLVARPKLVGAKAEELFEALREPEDWTRHHARRVLKERVVHKQPGHEAVLPALQAWVKRLKPDEEATRLEALWTYQALDVPEPELLRSLLEAKDHRVRAAATRVASAWLGRLKDPMGLLAARVHDEHPRVRMEAVRALSGLKSTKAAEVALQALDRPVDKFLDYALWLTTQELQAAWLPALQRGEITFGGNVGHLTFALKTAGSPAGVRPLVEMLRAGKVPTEREENVLALIAALGSPQELRMVFDQVVSKNIPDKRKVILLEGLAQAMHSRKVKPAGELKDLVLLLIAEPDPVRIATMRLAGMWKLEEVRDPITWEALRKERAFAVRQAAAESLAGMGGPKSQQTFLAMTDKSLPFEVRSLGAIHLAPMDVKASAKAAAEILSTAPPSADPTDLIAAFVRQKQGSESLAQEIAKRKLAADVAKIALRVARSSGREVKELSEALRKAGGLTTPVRTLTKTQLDGFLTDVAKKGDAARGEMVYRRKDQACLKCHAIAGAGGQVGPDMTSIGASAQVDYLVESLLQPNAKIKEGYHSLMVTTDRGKIFTGVKVRETGKELILRDAEDKEIVIPKKEIEEQKNGGSLMPEGLTDELTRGELIDLVRFLSELGKVGPYQVGREKLVRRWQVLETGRETTSALIRMGLAAGASDAPWQVWSSAYGTVSGVLPLEDLPWSRVRRELEQLTQTQALARCQLEVTTPGKVKLVFNTADGVTLFLDGAPVEAAKEMVVDLKSGMHTLTVGLEREKRRQGLRLEVVDVSGSAAQVRVVGGK